MGRARVSFDRFMVQVDIGTNRKLRRLPPAQRWAYVAGVLPLAAQSPLRGALLITDGEPVTAEDVAEEATVRLCDARACLDALRKLGMLERDELGVEWVHDWDRHNPEPKPSDSPQATRERKRKQRERQKVTTGHAQVTRDMPECHAPEEEGEEKKKTPPIPPRGGRARDVALYEEQMAAYAAYLLPHAPEPDRTQSVRMATGWMRGRVAGELKDHHVLRWIREHAPDLLVTEVAA